jgi:hypothetical protein
MRDGWETAKRHSPAEGNWPHRRWFADNYSLSSHNHLQEQIDSPRRVTAGLNKPKMLGAPSISRSLRNGWEATNPANLLTRDFRAAEANLLIFEKPSASRIAFIGTFPQIVL